MVITRLISFSRKVRLLGDFFDGDEGFCAWKDLTVLGHGLVAIEHGPDHQFPGLKHDPQIETKANIADIKGIPLISPENGLETGSWTTISSNLRKPGDAGTGHIAEIVIGYEVREFLGVLQHMRPGPHDAHLPKQDIYELGKFIETGVTHEPAHTGNAGIILGRPPCICIIVDIHGPEFIAPEGLP